MSSGSYMTTIVVQFSWTITKFFWIAQRIVPKENHVDCLVVFSWLSHFLEFGSKVQSANQRDAPDIKGSVTGIDQHKAPDSVAWQYPSSRSTKNYAKVDRSKLRNSVSFPILARHLANWLPLFKHLFFKNLDNFFREKWFTNDTIIKNAFSALIASRTPDFCPNGMNKSWQKYFFLMTIISINEFQYEISCNVLKILFELPTYSWTTQYIYL